MADKAYKKWRNKQKAANSLNATVFRKSYIIAGQSNHFDLVLWFGLSVLLTGTIVSFVGLGEKGFRTSYLRLLGPILCGFGLAVVIIRIGICCINGRKKKVSANCYVKDQLAKVVTVQHAVAVRSIQYNPGEGPAIIPSIQIDPSKYTAPLNKSFVRVTLLSLLTGSRLRLGYDEEQYYRRYRPIARGKKSRIIGRECPTNRYRISRTYSN